MLMTLFTWFISNPDTVALIATNICALFVKSPLTPKDKE